MTIRLAAALVATMLLVASCAYKEKAYEGPQLPPERVATIEAGELDMTRKVLISTIDGKMYSPSLSATELLPGRHRMEVWYWDMRSRFPFWTSYAYVMNAEFEVVAGRTYKFDAEGEWSETPAPIRVWLTDTADQSVLWEGEADASRPNYIME